MNSPFAADSAHDDLVEQAHEVLARLPRTQVDVLEHPDVIAFMTRSTRHRETMVRVARLWGALGSVTALPWPTQEELAADLDVENGASSTPTHISRRHFLPWAAGLAALSIAVWGARSVYDPAETARYETPTGEHRTIELPDGSVVHLGAQSRLSATFSSGARNVRLETGEALFDVAHDLDRPFTVRSGDAIATAVGTAFNVRRSDARASVSVVEGIVSVSVDGSVQDPLLLKVGEQVSIDAGTVGPVVQRETHDMIGWRTGRFTYIAEPLPAVIADLSRYSAQSLEFEGAASNRLSYTGVVAREHLADWLLALEATFPVTVERSNDRVVVRER